METSESENLSLTGEEKSEQLTPLVLCGIRLCDSELILNFRLQILFALFQHVKGLSQTHNGVLGGSLCGLGLAE